MKKLVAKIKNNKILKFVYGFIKTIIMIILVLILAVILIQRVTNNKLSLGGYRIYTVVTRSMEPRYKVGDILVSKEIASKDIRIGDNAVYLGKEADFKDKIVTHEVIKIAKDEKTGKINFVTKGINNTIEDPEISEDQIYGIVTYKTVFLSFISRIMTSPIGCFIIFGLVTLFASIQIVINIFSDDDEDDEDGNQESKDDKSEKEVEIL